MFIGTRCIQVQLPNIQMLSASITCHNLSKHAFCFFSGNMLEKKPMVWCYQKHYMLQFIKTCFLPIYEKKMVWCYQQALFWQFIKTCFLPLSGYIIRNNNGMMLLASILCYNLFKHAFCLFSGYILEKNGRINYVCRIKCNHNIFNHSEKNIVGQI